jgi:hypothetical protein
MTVHLAGRKIQCWATDQHPGHHHPSDQQTEIGAVLKPSRELVAVMGVRWRVKHCLLPYVIRMAVYAMQCTQDCPR